MQLVRRFWIAASCTLAVLIGMSVGQVAQAQQTKLLPNDTEMIVTINLKQILKSEVVGANKALLDTVKDKVTEQLDDKGISKYLKKADFDMFRDLHSISIAVPGGNRNPNEGFILLEGSFDAEKIEAAATDASNEAGGGLKVKRIANVKAFVLSPKDEKTIYVGVLNRKTMIVASSEVDFSEAVGRFNGTKQSSLKAEVKTLLETVNNKQSLSIVATSAVLAKIAENSPQGGGDQAKQFIAAIQQVEGLSMAITIQKNIDFQIGVNTREAKKAGEFALLGNLFLTGARAKVAEQAKQNEKLGPLVEVLNTLKLSAQGTNLVLRGQINYETLGKVLQNLPIPGN